MTIPSAGSTGSTHRLLHRAGMLAVVAIAWMLASPALARGESTAETMLRLMEARLAPLALSGDGKWLVHVDERNMLYRQRPDSRKPAQRLQLPLRVRSLATSASGRYVVAGSWDGCVGMVDFGETPAAAPAFAWTPGAAPRIASPDTAQDADGTGCPQAGWQALALSGDGRLLATQAGIMDLRSGRRISSLPDAANQLRNTLRLQFIDNDSKLLMVSASMGGEYEGFGEPDDIGFAVWDVRSGALLRLTSRDGASSLPEGYFHGYSAATGQLYWMDTEAFRRGQWNAGPDAKPAALTLMRQAIGACRPRPTAILSLRAWEWQSLLVDPLGRWIAGVRRLDRDAEGKHKDGFTDELVAFDLKSGKPIASWRSAQSLRGLVASADGATIHGLASTLPDNEVERHTLGGGALVRFRLKPYRHMAPLPLTPAWEADACTIEDETPPARSVQASDRLLSLAWTAPLGIPGNDRASSQAGEPDASPDCEEGHATRSVKMRDGSLWIDTCARVARLDTRSGRVLETLRKPCAASEECNNTIATSMGFVVGAGDTLAWQPLRADGASAPRHIAERRPGWRASQIQVSGQRIAVFWTAHENTQLELDEEGIPINLRIATYDGATLAFRSEHATQVETLEAGDITADPHWVERLRKPCDDGYGGFVPGNDWRISHFSSFRVYACDAGGRKVRTVLWTGMRLGPPSSAQPESHEPGSGEAHAVAGDIAVTQDGKFLRVFEISTRRELGRIEVGDSWVRAIHVLSDERTIVVDVHAMDRSAILRGYALP